MFEGKIEGNHPFVLKADIKFEACSYASTIPKIIVLNK